MDRMDGLDMCRCLALLSRRTRAFISEACEPLGITYLECMVLASLFRGDGASQEELAAALTIDKALVTRTARALEQKNWIRREGDPSDRRVKRLYLEEPAREHEKYLLEAIRAWGCCILGGIEPSEAETSARNLGLMAEQAARADIAGLLAGIGEASRCESKPSPIGGA